MVRGGEVRLQQVVMNLLANAVDAIGDRPERRIEITLDAGDPVVLGIRDTGPGIEEPGKIFDPFYTTKEVGRSEGMGLGSVDLLRAGPKLWRRDPGPQRDRRRGDFHG